MVRLEKTLLISSSGPWILQNEMHYRLQFSVAVWLRLSYKTTWQFLVKDHGLV